MVCAWRARKGSASTREMPVCEDVTDVMRVEEAIVVASLSNLVAAASTSARSARPARLHSQGSFHAGAPIPHLAPYDERQARRPSATSLGSRRLSAHGYHTFPTPPPKTPSDLTDAGFAAVHGGSDGESDSELSSAGDGQEGDDVTPLPWRQLCLLALLSLCEQTALNSIGPYLPTMVASFDEIPEGQTGLYVGLLASSFALAQLATNFLWGYLSDTVGRKPIMLVGTSLLCVCFLFFGFCRNFPELIAVHVAMGLLNGNAAVVPTCLGEVTDRTNQSRAFTWLPVIYSIGGITGPALGGLLVGIGGDDALYPFLAPNVMSAGVLLIAVVVLAVWFEETLDDAEKKASSAGLAWVERIFNWGGIRERPGHNRSWSGRWPMRSQSVSGTDAVDDEQSDNGDAGDAESQTLLSPADDGTNATGNGGGKQGEARKSIIRQLANRTTVTVLITYLFFQLSNISFNCLYPIFASAAPPTGRGLGPETIGLSMSVAGLGTILFQVFLFGPLKTRLGNLGTYRIAILGIAVTMAMMPWIGYLEDSPEVGIGRGKGWLYGELGVILIAKNIFAVGGLSSVMLLITNSAPSHETLGTLNGIAQTLSAAGRSVGPFLSGAVFTLSEQIRPKGEALAWGLFAGIALVGWVGTLSIRGAGLESSDWVGQDGHGDADSGEEESQPDQAPR
ncbi:MFS general substrate transporter [Thozetella sp. PMI_491]|nr:MFS general substrate transporter [Thozetella sp. PMI_491]